MIVSVGDIIASESGTGKIVAITDEWIVHHCEDGSEVAISIQYSEFWIPAEAGENGTKYQEREID